MLQGLNGLGALGAPVQAGGNPVEMMLSQLPASLDPQTRATLEQMAVQDPAAFMAVMEQSLAPPTEDLMGGLALSDPYAAAPSDDWRAMLSAPTQAPYQQPLDPDTVQRVARALGLSSTGPESFGDPMMQGGSDDSLMTLLGGTGYGQL